MKDTTNMTLRLSLEAPGHSTGLMTATVRREPQPDGNLFDVSLSEPFESAIDMGSHIEVITAAVVEMLEKLAIRQRMEELLRDVIA